MIGSTTSIDPRLVYHGRGLDRNDLASVFEMGLRDQGLDAPRSHPRKPAVPGPVYLTTDYPVFYVELNAASRGSLCAAIFKIELSPLLAGRLLPDEDFLDEFALIGKMSKPWLERAISTPEAPRLDPRGYPGMWRDSMDELGNFSLDGIIPIGLVRRIALVRRISDLLNLLNVDEHITIGTAPDMTVFTRPSWAST